MTPDGWCSVFYAGLDSLGGQECTPFSPEIPHNGQNGPKTPQKGVYPPFCTFFILYLYNFFPGASRSPKMVFFYPNMGTGLKKHHFGALAGTRNKIIEVQDKKRAKRGVPPFVR